MKLYGTFFYLGAPVHLVTHTGISAHSCTPDTRVSSVCYPQPPNTRVRCYERQRQVIKVTGNNFLLFQACNGAGEAFRRDEAEATRRLTHSPSTAD